MDLQERLVILMNSIIIQFRVASPCDFTRGPHKVAFWVFLGICWLYNVIHLYYPLTAFARRETSLQCRFCKRGPHLVEGFAGRISLSWIQLRYINTSCFSWLCLTTWKKQSPMKKKTFASPNVKTEPYRTIINYVLQPILQMLTAHRESQASP